MGHVGDGLGRLAAGTVIRMPTPDQNWAAFQAYIAWSREQVAAGLDGPVPPGRKSPSDYNLHVPLMEAPGGALDDLDERMRRALEEPTP